MALDCVEIDELAPRDEVVAVQDLADRISLMHTKLIRRVQSAAASSVDRVPFCVTAAVTVTVYVTVGRVPLPLAWSVRGDRGRPMRITTSSGHI